MSKQESPAVMERKGHVDVGDGELWAEQRGRGPDVLLLCGLSDPVEAWQPQLDSLSDRYRLTVFDNRGAGRTKLSAAGSSPATMADDAAAVMAALDVERAHVMGFSGGSAIAQEVALRHPERVSSLVLVGTYAWPDAYFRSMLTAFRWLVTGAPSERAMLESFFLWVYTPRAHANGMVEAIIEEALEFPHPQKPEEFQAQIDAFLRHDTRDRLHGIHVPTLVLTGALDIIAPPRYGRIVADLIPGAEFVVMPDEAHQPFQEVPEEFDALAEAFWHRLGSRV
jgi:pimeloyl-ACP methyl ester carboxylesterase